MAKKHKQKCQYIIITANCASSLRFVVSWVVINVTKFVATLTQVSPAQKKLKIESSRLPDLGFKQEDYSCGWDLPTSACVLLVQEVTPTEEQPHVSPVSLCPLCPCSGHSEPWAAPAHHRLCFPEIPSQHRCAATTAAPKADSPNTRMWAWNCPTELLIPLTLIHNS